MIKWVENKLHTIDGRDLISSNNIVDELNIAQLKSLDVINNLTEDDFKNLIKNGFLSSSEKILLFDILNLFNSIEVNFNRILGLNSNSGSGLSGILNPKNSNPLYNRLFKTDISLAFKKTLQEYIEIRNLIAHGIAKKHLDTNSILFITSNKSDWNNKLRKRKENPEKLSDRPDRDVLLKEMGEKSIIYAVINVRLLKYLQEILMPIDKYFAEYAAIETR